MWTPRVSARSRPAHAVFPTRLPSDRRAPPAHARERRSVRRGLSRGRPRAARTTTSFASSAGDGSSSRTGRSRPEWCFPTDGASGAPGTRSRPGATPGSRFRASGLALDSERGRQLAAARSSCAAYPRSERRLEFAIRLSRAQASLRAAISRVHASRILVRSVCVCVDRSLETAVGSLPLSRLQLLSEEGEGIDEPSVGRRPRDESGSRSTATSVKT